MRDYGKVYTAFWQSEDIRSMSEDGRTMAFYLMTCPHGNMLGCFRLPDTYAGEDLQWEAKRVRKGFDELFGKGFAYRCERTFWVFIRHHLKWNHFENPNVATKAFKLLDSLRMPNTQKGLVINALREFGKHVDPAKLTKVESTVEPFANPFDTNSKTIAVAVAVAEPEPEPEPPAKPIVELTPDRATKGEVVAEIFAYWQRVMNSPGSKLDDKRRKLIEGALKNYQPREICLAILGCSRTPHNMGENDRNTKYNGLNVILRDADQIDRFIGAASRTPTMPKASLSIQEQNERAIAEFLGTDGAGDDPTIIDVEMNDAS